MKYKIVFFLKDIVYKEFQHNILKYIWEHKPAILNILKSEGPFDRRAVIIWLESRACTPRYRSGRIVSAAT